MPRAGAVVALFVISIAARARAEEPLTLKWQGPPSCARADQVKADVLRLAGPSAGHAAPVHADVGVTREPSGFRITLHTTQLGESGERQFAGKTCDEVADATALVLSVMLAPVPTTETVKEQGFRPKPTPAPAPAPALREAPAPVPEAPKTQWGVGPRVGGDVGTLPRPTLFAGGAGWFAWSRVRLELGASIWVPRDTTSGPRDDAGALVGLWAGHSKGCFAFLPGSTALEGCLGAAAGRASGRGQGIQNPSSAGASYVALLPGATLRSRVGPLPASLGLDVPVALVRPAFEIDGYGRIYRASPVALRATLGVDFSP